MEPVNNSSSVKDLDNNAGNQLEYISKQISDIKGKIDLMYINNNNLKSELAEKSNNENN